VEPAASRKKAKTVPFAPVSPQATINSNLRAVRRSPRVGTKRPVHPRHIVRIRGCTPSVYAVVTIRMCALSFAQSSYFHPAFKRRRVCCCCLTAQAIFQQGPDGYGHWLKEGVYTTKNVEADVAADTIEVGKRQRKIWRVRTMESRLRLFLPHIYLYCRYNVSVAHPRSCIIISRRVQS